MKNTLAASLGLVAFCGFCSLSFAHHGSSAYDKEHKLTLKGTVTDFKFVNPHSVIYFDVKDPKGEVLHWVCEGGGPVSLSRDGWTKDSLKPGDEVIINLDPAKNGLPEGEFNRVWLADGKELTHVHQ